MLTLTHFHTKTRQALDSYDTINNCLAEYLFPETEFSLGIVYPKGTQPEDLQGYEGKSLQFATGKRMYFADANVGEQLYPVASDRTAYGSLPFTPCLSLQEVTASVLVVDDITGSNGGLFSVSQAKEWVGDCFGRISSSLCEVLTGQCKKPFQFRLGIKPQENCAVYRLAKGTLAASDLDKLIPSSDVEISQRGGRIYTHTGFDLVLPSSSFKGRKGEEAIQPGAYQLTLAIGVKTLANYRQHSLGTQVLINYPMAVLEEMLPKLDTKMAELAVAQEDVRMLASYYVKAYESRRHHQQQTEDEWEELGDDIAAMIDEAFADNQKREDMVLYRLLKYDVEHHAQLLEHPKIVESLRQFVRRQWLDLATGRAIKFNSGLAQPSWHLEEDEVSIPILPDGEEVIVSRSPLLNSNGVVVLTNRLLRETVSQEGVVYIHPDTAAKYMQADFDGDFLFFALAADYPVLTEEVKYYLQPQHRFADVIKPEKKAYTGSLEEIACAAQDNQIGIIANQIQRAMALRWECALVSKDKQIAYVKQIQQGYRQLTGMWMPKQFQQWWQQICRLPSALNEQQAEKALMVVQDILYDVIGELSNQLQIAADGFKSRQRPHPQVLEYCQGLSGYRRVIWILDKKNPDVFLERGMNSGNNSPIDWMIRDTNRYFRKCGLESQPLVSFRELFQGIDYTAAHEKMAEVIKANYNEYAAIACELEQKAQQQDEPVLVVTSTKSKQPIVIERILDYASQNQFIWRQKSLNLELIAGDNNRLLAVSKISASRHTESGLLRQSSSQPDNKVNVIGMVSWACQKRQGLCAGLKLTNAKIEIDEGVTELEVKAAFKRLSDYVDLVRQELSAEDTRAIGAALWHKSHPRKKSGLSGKANAVFGVFPELILERLQQRQFNHFQVVGVHHNAYKGRFWQGEEVTFAVEREENKKSPLYQRRVVKINGETLAPFASESARLLKGTIGQAKIYSQPGATVTAISPKGNSLTLQRASSYGDRQWQGEKKRVSLAWLAAKKKWTLSCEGVTIGELDKKSTEKLARRKLLEEGRELILSFSSSPSTTAMMEVFPETLYTLSREDLVWGMENRGR